MRRLYHEVPLASQQAIDTEALARILNACIRDAEQALITEAEYLGLLGFPGRRCEARELWRHLIEAMWRDSPDARAAWQQALHAILEQGTLARRILRAVGAECTRARLRAVYRELCDCLEQGRMFEWQ